MADLAAPLDRLRAMQRRYPERAVHAHGATWRLRDTGGDGPVVILLPGGLGNADIFYKQLLDLPPRLRCIAVDYPCADPAPTADGLAAVLDALGLERASLLGSSLAGYWLQHFGVRHVDRVDALILANSFCESDEFRQHPLFSVPVLSEADGDTLKAEWLAMLEDREASELRDAQIAILREGREGEALRQRLLAAATAPSAPLIERGMFPIFLLDCDDDPIVSLATRTAMAERYPDAVRLTLPDGGHYPAVTQAAAFNRFVLGAVPDL